MKTFENFLSEAISKDDDLLREIAVMTAEKYTIVNIAKELIEKHGVPREKISELIKDYINRYVLNIRTK